MSRAQRLFYVAIWLVALKSMYDQVEMLGFVYRHAANLHDVVFHTWLQVVASVVVWGYFSWRVAQ